MKNFHTTIITILLLCLPISLYAESVFLKNGAILEGKIKKDTDKEVTINIVGKDKTVLRRNILRVLYGDDYKTKQYIFLNNDSTIEAYIVGENRDSYIYRRNLNSARETKIKKDQVKFISKKKISLAEMQKKKKIRKLLSGRKEKFRNLLGLRFGAAYLNGYPEVNDVDTFSDTDGPLMIIGLYYFDKYFEFDWLFGLNFDDSDKTLSHIYMFNLLPFNMFNVGIGITIGYTKLIFNLYSHETSGVSLEFEGIMIGLMYRFEGWFRIGLGYMGNVATHAELNGGSPLVDDGSKYNFYAFIEVFAWKNLSFSANYYYTETYHSEAGLNLDYRTHFISIQASFGLNVF